jgi:hypothetical protein
MIQVKVKTTNNINRRLDKMKRDIANLPKEAHKVVLENTPIRSGNARRKTVRKGESIVANYPYAVRLDEGWSKQSPDGMTKPTQEFIAKRLEQIAKG